MKVTISPALLTGEAAAIPSKSHVHRALIGAALADAPTTLTGCHLSGDIRATMGCIEALGAACCLSGDTIYVEPIKERPAFAALDCGESGSTLRFLLPVAAAICTEAHFTGTGRLPQRPIAELLAVLRTLGASFSSEALPLLLHGPIHSGLCRIRGDVSSQYISGLLMALPLLVEGGEISLTTPLASASYVDITLAVLSAYSVKVEHTEQSFFVPPGQRYRTKGSLHMEGDWSNAAFFLAAGALCAPVCVTGLSMDSPQGDKAIVQLLGRFGAKVEIEGQRVTVRPGTLRGMEIDVSDTPDLVPILAVLAAYATGETRILGASRLRLKESDRIASVCRMLCDMGGSAEELADGLRIEGKGTLRGGRVDSAQDHRIAMAAAVAALRAAGETEILQAEAVAKSYPGFYEDYTKLGGNVHGDTLG